MNAILSIAELYSLVASLPSDSLIYASSGVQHGLLSDQELGAGGSPRGVEDNNELVVSLATVLADLVNKCHHGN